ncbi:Signal transduction histidine kinase [Salegentibacter salinarum]|uniref:tetratricopeptide repeat-containing hybrid sensor histidine kinase/response regulator n=1 Tax=Salegentibacter salinarum TaxID=447422 RepID=UPI0009D097F0|nr:response regulator [Salegentibacter salinarum]SKB93056.1 Signal transduction histidine kinase [Salegentibacter salinarum]
MRIKNVTVLLIFLVSSLAFSQSKESKSSDSIKELLDLSTDAMYSYEYTKAIDYSLNLIELAEEEKDYYHLYHGYNNLGITYDELYDTIRAKESYENALKYAKIVKNDTLLWWAFNNLGNMYTSNKETIDQGFAYYDQAIKAASNLDDPDSRATPLINKGWTHLYMEEYDEAYPYLIEVQKLIEDFEDPYILSQIASLFGNYHSGKNNYEKSKEYYEKAIEIAEKDSLYYEAVTAYDGYAETLFKNEEFEEAYNALDKYIEYDAELYEKEKLEQMETAQARFETKRYRENLEIAKREQKYKDEVIAKSQQNSIIMIISLIVMLFFIILLVKNNSTRKKLISQLKNKNSELITAKDEAERLSMLKSQFFSTVSHELRTPLYGVVGLTSLLLDDKSLKKHESDLKSLKFSADYLLALINDVLQMNKMESKQVKLENVSFNIKELILSIVNTFEFTRLQNKNKVHYNIDEKIPENLIGDPVRLSQILMNLVGNAVKFTENGNIHINVELQTKVEDRAVIYFEVKDDGIGIPKSKQKLIFEEFSQLKPSNYNYQGTGLGLPIVKRLLQLYESQIHLKSKEGEGSVFCFSLSLKEDKSSTKKAGFAHEVYLDNLKEKQRILIVDDNRINQVVTRRILEKQNFECVVVGNGVEAIERVTAENFDLILMDLNMPGINGMETTKRIREISKNVPVVALTAVEIEEVRNEIYAAGMNDIIVKPYDVERFYQTIKRNLSSNLETSSKD